MPGIIVLNQGVSTQIIKEYKDENSDNTDCFFILDILQDVLKFVDESVANSKKHELVYPSVLEYFISVLKKSFKETKSSTDTEISILKHEKNVLQGIIDKTKEMMDKGREEYENQIKEIKDEQLNQRLDVINSLIFRWKLNLMKNKR